MDNTLHLIIGCTLGAFVLGYLLAEMVYMRMLDKAQRQLCELADQIEALVADNDGASQLVEKLRSNIEFMDSNALTLLNKNRELTAQVQQQEALLQLVPDRQP